jgi:hypothetical protein
MGTNIWQKLAVATVGTVLSFATLEANPAQAAFFLISFDNLSSYNGFLQFDDASSGLTGIGREEVSLSQLNGSFPFLYQTTSSLRPETPLIWSGNADILSEPIFSFESGSLVGMKFNLASKEATWRNPGPGNGLWVQTHELFIQDATYRLKKSLVIKGSYPLFCNPVFYPYYVDIEKCSQNPTVIPVTTEEKTGSINFVNYIPFQPPKSVPEPGSVIGFSVLGLSLLLKKKVASSQRT